MQATLASDKRLVGALDSACNRIVCGQRGLDSYLKELRSSPDNPVPEDSLLSGMLAAKQTKGARAAIQGQLMDKLRAEAAVAKEKGEELQAASSLLGPKGGLPTLKRRTSFAQLPCYMWRSVVPRRSKRSSTRFARWWAHCGGTASSSGAPPVATPVLPVPAREPPQVHRTILDYSLARLGRWLPNQAPSPLRPSCWRK